MQRSNLQFHTTCELCWKKIDYADTFGISMSNGGGAPACKFRFLVNGQSVKEFFSHSSNGGGWRINPLSTQMLISPDDFNEVRHTLLRYCLSTPHPAFHRPTKHMDGRWGIACQICLPLFFGQKRDRYLTPRKFRHRHFILERALSPSLCRRHATAPEPTNASM